MTSLESDLMNGYRLISGRSQDRNLLPVSLHFSCFTEATFVFTKTPFNRRGAPAARRFTLWAHNSEVTGSTPVAGISIQFGCFIEAPRHSFGDAKHEHINNRYSVNGNTRFTLGSELQDQRLVTGIIHNTLHLFTEDSGHS